MNLAVCIVCLLPGASLETGWHHQYQGQLTDREEGVSKRFTVDCIVSETGIYWAVDERGSGAWPWSSRFGKWTSDADVAPALLYRTDDVTAVVELPPFHFQSPQPLKSGAAWEQEGASYSVRRDGDLWRVDSRDAYGMRTSSRVTAGQPLLQSYDRDVVVGRGERLRLTLRLVKSETLSETSLASAGEQYDALLKLREDLGKSDRVRENRWSKQQLATLREALPEEPAVGMQQVLTEAQTEVREQGTRANALKKMQQDAIGKVVSLDFETTDLRRGKLPAKTVENKVVVLHFWTYKSKPLEEPYGQVGYVDFLYRKLPADKATVVGVVGPDREQGRDSQSREARKLKQFMNLSFPVVLDNGSLAKLGDPTRAGGELPLFVVLDADGRVIHYHPGHYPVDRQEGLKELKQVVMTAVDDPAEE